MKAPEISVPPSLRWLAALAAGQYLCGGVFLVFFSNTFDFRVIHQAAAQVAHGEASRIYDAFFAFGPGASSLFYMYPPTVAGLLSPLGFLEYQTASKIFTFLSHIALWSSLALWTSRRGLSAEGRWRAFIVLFLFFPVAYSLQLGQTEPLILLCLAGAVRLLDREQESASALLLCLAVFLKLFLGVLLLYFLARRRWRYLAFCLLWLGTLFALGLLVLPWPAQAAYWTRLAAPLGIESFYDNQSLCGFLHRLLSVSRYGAGFVDAPELARGLQWVLSASLLGSFFALCAGSRLSARRGMALGLITALLAAPHSDTHHHALLVFSFWTLLEEFPEDWGLLVCYGFFAVFTPLVGFKFLSPDRLALISRGAFVWILSLPFFVLGALWLRCAQRYFSMW